MQDAAKVYTYKLLKKYNIFQYNDTGMVPNHPNHQLLLDDKLDHRNGYSVSKEDPFHHHSSPRNRSPRHLSQPPTNRSSQNGHHLHSAGPSNGHYHHHGAHAGHPAGGHHAHDHDQRFEDALGAIRVSPTGAQGTAVSRKPFFVSTGHAPLPPPPLPSSITQQHHPPPQDSNVLKGD